MRFNTYKLEEEYIENFTNWQQIDYFNKIFEVFNRSSNIKITINRDDFFETTFIINSKKYIFQAKLDKNLAVVLFYPLDDEVDIFKERKDKLYLGKLFASLFQSVKEMLNNNNNIIELAFTSETENLEKLYKRMSSIFLKRFPEGKVKTIKNGLFYYIKEG